MGVQGSRSSNGFKRVSKYYVDLGATPRTALPSLRAFQLLFAG